MKTEIHLRNLLLIFMTFIFACLLIYQTGEFQLYWTLYAVPVFIAAYTFYLPGALILGVISILSISGWFYIGTVQGAIEGSLITAVYQVSLGTSIFFVSGLVFGHLAGRQRKQQDVLSNLSIQDGLTDLYNYGYFKSRLREEIKRAERYETSLGLIMIDIDHFKEFNDVFGHVKGNYFLNKLAKIIKHRIRDIDIAARYGGEEFAILLPYASEGVRLVAERIRKDVEKAEFEGDALGPIVKKTISAGVAVFPTDATDETELVVKADQALYSAKGAGRNKVCEYSKIKDSVEKSTVKKGSVHV